MPGQEFCIYILNSKTRRENNFMREKPTVVDGQSYKGWWQAIGCAIQKKTSEDKVNMKYHMESQTLRALIMYCQ